MKRFYIFYSVVLIGLKVLDAAVVYSPKGDEARQNMVDRLKPIETNAKERILAKDGVPYALKMTVPPVSVTLFGEKYEVGGDVNVPIVVVSSLPLGTNAQWDQDLKAIKITQGDWDRYKIAAGKRPTWQKWWDLGWSSPGGVLSNFVKLLRHEAIHSLACEKYEKSFPSGTEALYHFMNEMLAYKGGDGYSDIEAAKKIRDGGLLFWKTYEKEVRDFASQFIKNYDSRVGGVQSVAEKVPDLSKLIDLAKQSVEYLRRINAMSQKPSEDVYACYNKLGAMARAEIKAIENEIVQMNLTEKEKVELGNELGKQIREKVMPYCDTLKSLRKQIEAKGYGRFQDSNFNFDPKYLK